MKAPRRYKNGGETPKKPVKVDLNTWSPEMEAMAKKAYDAQNNPAAKKNQLLYGGSAYHAIGSEGSLAENQLTKKQYADFMDDPQYKYISGNPGQRIFESSKISPYGKNEVIDPNFPDGKPIKYVESTNADGTRRLLQVPTTTYKPNEPVNVSVTNTTPKPFIYNVGEGTYAEQEAKWNAANPVYAVEGKAKGGKVTKAPKRYAIGGKVGALLSDEKAPGLITGGAEVAGMGGNVIDAKSIDPETGLYKSQGAAIGSGALKGAGQGAKMGVGIGTLFGPQGAAIGAAGGALLGAGVGATVGGIKQKKATTALEKAEALAAQEEKQQAIKDRYALGLSRQLTQRQEGYAGGGTVGTAKNVDGEMLTEEELNASMSYVPDAGNVEKQKFGLPEFGGDTSRIGLTASFKKGGYVHGPGTGTSDSVKAKIEAGSFITPAKNAKAAEKVLELVKGGKITKAPSTKKKADLDQEDGEEVKLSKGEFVFTPEQREEIISELGEDVLEALAPDAEHGEDEMKKGGLTAAKAKIILHDGTIRGKAITDKQRKYFGAIASGYECGGKVKKYADGTTPEGVLSDDERAKLASQEKAIKEKESAYTSKAEKEKKLAEVRAEAYKKSMEAQDIRLKSKKALDAEVKRLEREYKAKKQSYDQYSRDQENLKNTKSSGGYRAQNNLYNEKEVIKKKKELLDLADKYKKDLDTRKNELNYWSNDANFNPDGSIKKDAKKTGPSRIDYLGTSKDKEVSPMVSKTGAEIETAANATANKGKVSTVPKIGKSSASKPIYTGSTGETSVSEVATETTAPVAPKYGEQGVKPTTIMSDTLKETVTEDGTGNKPSNAELLKAGMGLGKQIGGLANYVIPYKQTQLGRKLLAESGKRPVGKIDPDFQAAVNKAQANAKFGYTPEEQALLDQRNISALRSGENAAKNYSGGSSSSALSLQRQAANDYFSRGLQSAIASKNLQMDKQSQANEMINQKAAMNRQLFGDTMNAWSQNQSAGGDLVSAGLQNLMGANRLQREMAFQEKYGRNSNPYTQDYFKGLNG